MVEDVQQAAPASNNAHLRTWQAALAQAGQDAARRVPTSVSGRLTRAVGLVLEAVGLQLPVGSDCLIELPPGYPQRHAEAEVVGFAGDRLFLMPQTEVAGLLPGALMVLMMSGHAMLIGRGIPESRHAFDARELWAALKETAWELPLPLIVLGGIYSGQLAASEASAVTALYVLLVTVWIKKEISIQKLPTVMAESMRMVGAILLILLWRPKNKPVPVTEPERQPEPDAALGSEAVPVNVPEAVPVDVPEADAVAVPESTTPAPDAASPKPELPAADAAPVPETGPQAVGATATDPSDK